MLQDFDIYSKPLSSLPEGRLLINTINAHSYNVSREDAEFKEALLASDVLIPDGISVVWAVNWLQPPSPHRGELRERMKKIAGEDLFYWEMEQLEQRAKSKEQRTKSQESRTKNQESRQEENEKAEAKAKVKAKAMFLGSTEAVLAKIKARAAVEYPNVEVHTYSPPYKPEFSDEDNRAMYAAIEAVQPNVLFVGMTAPKQEKWAYKLVTSYKLRVKSKELGEENKNSELKPQNSELSLHICCIGAVFDFYAGTVERAPKLFINLGLEWFYRLIKEPRRMWRRYLIGNVKFVGAVLKEWVMIRGK